MMRNVCERMTNETKYIVLLYIFSLIFSTEDFEKIDAWKFMLNDTNTTNLLWVGMPQKDITDVIHVTYTPILLRGRVGQELVVGLVYDL